MKFSNLVCTAAAGLLSLSVATAATAEECVIALPFDFGSSELSGTNQGLLDVIRTKYGSSTVRLAGFTDAVGSSAANQRLSERRVATVTNYLQSNTDVTVLGAQAFGESRLKVADTGPNQLNRRVEVSLDNCNPADFGQGALAGGGGLLPFGAGGLGAAGVAGAVLGSALIVGALGDSDSSTTTTTE